MSIYQLFLNQFPQANDYQRTELDQLASAIEAKAESGFYQKHGHFPDQTQKQVVFSKFLDSNYANWINAAGSDVDFFVKNVRTKLSAL